MSNVRFVFSELGDKQVQRDSLVLFNEPLTFRFGDYVITKNCGIPPYFFNEQVTFRFLVIR